MNAQQMPQANPQVIIQPQTQSYTSSTDDEIDLKELFSVLWAGKISIVVITAIATVLAVLFSLMQPDIYRAEALLASAAEEQGGGLSALAGQFGGLASLAGVELGGGSSQIDQTLAVLKSRAFTEQFIEKHALLVPLFAMKPARFLSRELMIDPTIYDIDEKKWVQDVASETSSVPSAWQAYAAFKSIVSINQDKQNGLITLAIEWFDPVQAKQWVDWLVQDLNAHLKHKDQAEAKRSIAYLQNGLTKTSIVGYQEVFYKLIENQSKTMMLAEIRDEYVLKTIDPAVVSEQKVRPKRALIVVLGVLLGGMLGMFWVFVRHF